MPVHAGLGWSHELRREDHSAVQVKPSNSDSACRHLICNRLISYCFCFWFFFSVHYPAYSLNVASMYLKLGRLYLGLEKTTQGVKALKKVCVYKILVNSWEFSTAETYSHKCLFKLNSYFVHCCIFDLIFFFSVSRHSPSWRWLMGKIIIMSLKSNEKLKSRSKRRHNVEGRDCSTAANSSPPLHATASCTSVVSRPLACDRLLRTVFFVCASSYSGQGRLQELTAAVSVGIIKCFKRKALF